MLQTVQLKNGETMAYRKRDGGNQTLLCIHGNMTSSKHWDVLLESLDTNYTIYAIDLRGFGGSSYHQPIRAIQDFSDDVKLFVDAIDLDHFDMIGWSTGGAVCMQFVANYPGYCQRLILLASASTRGYPFYSDFGTGIPAAFKRAATYQEVLMDTSKTKTVQGFYDTKNSQGLKSIWDTFIYTHRQPDPEHYDAYVADMLTQRNLAEVYHALNTFNLSAVDNEVAKGTNEVQQLNIPILVLRGDRDLVITEQMNEETMGDLAKHAQFVSLKNCGHSPLIDDLQQLLFEIETFLQFGGKINALKQ
ncbi:MULTISPECIES: intracellular short-chain-length polyhydroxyalkanoate depolymerase [Lysinibacillus]|uniref:Alpha/beta hydrolase n=1 Tax=Lysinibacillus varians TaxID=1145276 RepID=A0ABY2T778_9BACI|nr:alpha/beta hydrolase [Lysinibacillus varians]AHN21793.1 3-oxoadipate enol-lactonase [Lysinibacillus varians]TKI52031.1 alpha/beta hydrolase [Lysinibacillus varians]